MKSRKVPNGIKSIHDLAKRKQWNDWEYYALKEEREYIKYLKNPKDILAYRKQREEEEFLNQL